MTVIIQADRKPTLVEAVEAAVTAFREFSEAFVGLGSIAWSRAPAKQRRAERRAEAAERQARYAATPTFDKLAAIAERRGKSARERERLLAAA